MNTYKSQPSDDSLDGAGEYDELIEYSDMRDQEDVHDEPLTLATAEGVFFDYRDGFLHLEFLLAKTGDILFEFHIEGDTVVRTPSRTYKFRLGEPQFDVAEDSVLKAYTSASVSSFFYHMVHWLEAVVCDVYQCSFRWEGEGPEGELNWNGHSESGILRLSWTGSNRQNQESLWFAPPFDRQVRLNKEAMVRSLYESFRTFVESDKYDRNEYEGEWFGEELLRLRSSLVEKWLATRTPKAVVR